ncbi:protein FLX-like 4 isoform X2 [Prunus yedoensis var. nudiflora]|uniref:Protein FLX-like 4 isoform X2 n=1 Tax=Prunus yedoensis var. nudiflora TaxID=2094558 RepID=A0A315ABN3_PRUYE|nr:protein FLX-like 4 isoform X2 [Prunus yedoensis var. nudiflora]
MMRHGPLPGLGPSPGHRPFEALPRPELSELLENKIAYQAAEIKQLTGDNHRLAGTHVDLRQDPLAEKEVQRLKAHMRSIQTGSDIQLYYFSKKNSGKNRVSPGGYTIFNIKQSEYSRPAIRFVN